MGVETRSKHLKDAMLKEVDAFGEHEEEKLKDKVAKKEKLLKKVKEKSDIDQKPKIRKRRNLHGEKKESNHECGSGLKINPEQKIDKVVDSKSKKNISHCKIVITIITIVMAVFLITVIVKLNVDVTANTDNSPVVLFRRKIDSLKTYFPKQTAYFWKLIGSASMDFLESENPKRPAVILLAGGPDTHATLENLASELSNSYSNSTVTDIDGMEYSTKDPHKSKQSIDKKLQDGFKTNSQVAVVRHFESIPAEASMIFHSYCENDNAPFKRVVIIFTVHTTEKLNTKENLKTNQKKVEKHLEEKWKNTVDKDHIAAMFSRVATTTAFVNPE